MQRDWVAPWLRILEVPGSNRDDCHQPSPLKVLHNRVNAKFAEVGQHLCVCVCACVRVRARAYMCMLNAFVCGTVAYDEKVR